MPKIRTNRTVAKRFKLSATGKLMRRCVGLNHLMRKKSKSRRRSLINGTVLFPGDAQRVTRMLGGSG
jgi:large subunit ribosomal protein L35